MKASKFGYDAPGPLLRLPLAAVPFYGTTLVDIPRDSVTRIAMILAPVAGSAVVGFQCALGHTWRSRG